MTGKPEMFAHSAIWTRGDANRAGLVWPCSG